MINHETKLKLAEAENMPEKLSAPSPSNYDPCTLTDCIKSLDETYHNLIELKTQSNNMVEGFERAYSKDDNTQSLQSLSPSNIKELSIIETIININAKMNGLIDEILENISFIIKRI